MPRRWFLHPLLLLLLLRRPGSAGCHAGVDVCANEVGKRALDLAGPAGSLWNRLAKNETKRRKAPIRT